MKRTFDLGHLKVDIDVHPFIFMHEWMLKTLASPTPRADYDADGETIEQIKALINNEEDWERVINLWYVTDYKDGDDESDFCQAEGKYFTEKYPKAFENMCIAYYS